jgi:hypothetical protein
MSIGALVTTDHDSLITSVGTRQLQAQGEGQIQTIPIAEDEQRVIAEHVCSSTQRSMATGHHH